MSFLVEKIRSIRQKFARWRNSSMDRKVAGATLVVAIFTGVSKIVFFGKELVVAWRFGTSEILDAFLVAYVVPSFIVNLVAGSMTAALIPTYMQVRENEGRENAQKLYESAVSLSVVLLALCAGLAAFFAPTYLRLLASGFASEKLSLTLRLLYVISPVIVLSGVTTIRGAALNAVEKFAMPALIPVTTPLLTVVFIVLLNRWLGIYALALGLLFGQLVEIYLLGRALKMQGVRNTFGWHGFDMNLRQVGKQYVPMLAGAFLLGSSPLVDQFFAASLPGGSVALLSYGNKIVSFPIHIAAMSIGTSVLPYFSSVLSRHDWRAARLMLIRYLKITFLVSVPITLLLALFSTPIVRILLQRGAFVENDTKIVSQVLALGALQIPFYLGGTLIVKLLSAMKANHVMMWGAALSLVINFIADYWLMKIFGVAGISFSTSFVYFFSFIYLFSMWNYLYGRLYGTR